MKKDETIEKKAYLVAANVCKYGVDHGTVRRMQQVFFEALNPEEAKSRFVIWLEDRDYRVVGPVKVEVIR